MPSGAVTRSYQISGDPGALFTLIVQNEDGHFYNFPENTVVSEEESVFKPAASFSSTATQLIEKEIPASGFYNGVITFPSIPDDDHYIITLIASNNTEINSVFSNTKKIFVSEKIFKYLNTTLTFSLLHSSSAVVEPSNYTKTGVSSSIQAITTNDKLDINWDFTLGSSTCTVLRQPKPSDFEFTTTKTTVTAGTSSTELELNNITGLSIGMVAAATGITAGTKITKIIKGYKNSGKSTAAYPVYDIPVAINTDGDAIIESKAGTVILDTASTFVVDRTITFTGSGAKASKVYNNTRFKIKDFKVAIDDIVTTTTAAVPDTVIHTTSANGIKAQEQYTVNGATTTSTTVIVDEVITNLGIGQRLQAISSGTLVGIPTVTAVNTSTKTITLSSKQTLADGITLTFSNSIVKGIGLKNSTTDPYVVSISTNDVTVNANQSIDSGATVTFVGSSRSGKISAILEVIEYGKDDLTLTLNLDNILKVG